MRKIPIFTTLALLLSYVILVPATQLTDVAIAHDDHAFSAGEPGNPKKPARVVQITAREADGKMMFIPDKIEVRKGEQIRFIIRNSGVLKHEFVLASVKDNDKHAELMKKYPDMEHDDPNAKSVDPGKTAEILWRFTKAGTFEFACLIPGHREAGMHGKAVVK
jgi:uncharacterized cupredoxin-like copper-binding protein